MKTIVTIVISLYMASALVIRAADPKTNWANNCAQCHGPDGRANTKMGKQCEREGSHGPERFRRLSLMRKRHNQSKKALSRVAKRQ